MVLWRAVSTSDILAALARLGIGRSPSGKDQPMRSDSRVGAANSDVPPRR